MRWDVDDQNESPESFPNRISEVTAWRLLSEMVRRHPRHFWIRSAWPVEGLPYDCLCLCDRKTLLPVLMVNRTGSGALVNRSPDDQIVMRWTSAWKPTQEAESAKGLWPILNPTAEAGSLAWDSPMIEWIRLRELDLSLAPPTHGLPPSTSSSLALRWVAQFLCIQFGSRRAWYSYCGRDLQGIDMGLHEGHEQWIRQHGEEDLGRLWYLVEGGQRKPTFAVSADGDLWSRDAHWRLQDEHVPKESMTALILRTAGDHLV